MKHKMCSIKMLNVLKDLKIGTKTICHLILNILLIQTGKNISGQLVY